MPEETAAAPLLAAHATPQERADRGRQARHRVPRSSHADFQLAKDRPDPLDILEAQSSRRVPELRAETVETSA